MEKLGVMKELLSFYKGKTVLITGHTGFKGTWLCTILAKLGATVIGYSNTEEYPLFQSSKKMQERITSVVGDIRDLKKLNDVFEQYQPEIVFHLAAQPLVRESYEKPVLTYETNVMGTVNICECVRLSDSVRSFVNITTDKVYENKEWEWGYREIDRLNGYDPYSNSKSCSELVTNSYKNSFLKQGKAKVSCVRAGNVIGGGDMAKDRIVPDCIRAAFAKKPIVIRNPYSVRPYQHVLEPLMAYLHVAKAQYEEEDKQGCYNIGPAESDCITTEQLVSIFCKAWGEGMSYEIQCDPNAVHEATFLRLDCSRIRKQLGWTPQWNIETAIQKVVEFSVDVYGKKLDAVDVMERQIEEYSMGEIK